MKKTEEPVSERIKNLLDMLASGNKSELGRAAGISGQAIADLIGGKKGGPSFPVLQKILRSYPAVNERWLIFGEGPMLKTSFVSAGIPNISPYMQGDDNPAINPALTRGSKGTHEGGMVVRNYHLNKEDKKENKPSASPAPSSPPIGTDLVQLVAEHDEKLAAHGEALAELRQLLIELQQPLK